MAKLCKTCAVEKDESEFYLWKKKGKTGLRHECKQCHMRHAKLSALHHPQRRRDVYWKFDLKKYGLTPESFNLILESQGNKCALFEICGHTQPGTRFNRWCVDHDHNTGKVRGLLCHTCNSSRVGSNDLDSIRIVTRYLEMANFKLLIKAA